MVDQSSSVPTYSAVLSGDTGCKVLCTVVLKQRNWQRIFGESWLVETQNRLTSEDVVFEAQTCSFFCNKRLHEIACRYG